ncbi:hypothetical protein HMPREF0063_10090 [Aeromicrobium marinum DSM 15272]|uniref:Uncharacterized protein n=1 Tax=Aeromicrobium marinum DSM 15272 TaxID=585531 RepID=E2S7T3_9ACTN|nr:hypothetical protein [Aeromicrobium marinum]EFQ84749.1 hypothetical protein HMPREF0063_10090 [Aeromicrobium marinum DSM 15272]
MTAAIAQAAVGVLLFIIAVVSLFLLAREAVRVGDARAAAEYLPTVAGEHELRSFTERFVDRSLEKALL